MLSTLPTCNKLRSSQTFMSANGNLQFLDAEPVCVNVPRFPKVSPFEVAREAACMLMVRMY